ncbi:MAG: DUF2281 domain-containing protein [Bacteroidota bacterium]
MQAHRTETTVGGDGSVTIQGVPFPEGEAVEVIVLPTSDSEREPRAPRQPGSARGLITVPDDFDAPLSDFEPYT